MTLASSTILSLEIWKEYVASVKKQGRDLRVVKFGPLVTGVKDVSWRSAELLSAIVSISGIKDSKG